MTFNEVVPVFSIIVILCICAAIALYLLNRLIDRLADMLVESGKYGVGKKQGAQKVDAFRR